MRKPRGRRPQTAWRGGTPKAQGPTREGRAQEADVEKRAQKGNEGAEAEGTPKTNGERDEGTRARRNGGKRGETEERRRGRDQRERKEEQSNGGGRN